MTVRSLHLTQGTVTFAQDEPFPLESGSSLSPIDIRFAVYGEPNAAGDNVVLVCHALSGSAEAHEWWPELFTPGAVFSSDRWCVVCANILGSCYGSTSPTSVNPATGAPFGDSFPLVTIGDIVRSQALLLDHLGISQLHAVLGASIGGMQALEWAIRFPSRVERCIAIAATPLSSLGLALNHIQRRAIALHPDLGLRLARELAMSTYKSPELFNERHGRNPNRSGEPPWASPAGRFDIAGYLDYQGEIFSRRFDPDTYTAITRAMDLWDPARDLGDIVYENIRARTTLVGISSDWLFPASDVRALAQTLTARGVDCSYREIESAHGHDAFLAEPHHANQLLSEILKTSEGSPRSRPAVGR